MPKHGKWEIFDEGNLTTVKTENDQCFDTNYHPNGKTKAREV